MCCTLNAVWPASQLHVLVKGSMRLFNADLLSHLPLDVQLPHQANVKLRSFRQLCGAGSEMKCIVVVLGT